MNSLGQHHPYLPHDTLQTLGVCAHSPSYREGVAILAGNGRLKLRLLTHSAPRTRCKPEHDKLISLTGPEGERRPNSPPNCREGERGNGGQRGGRMGTHECFASTNSRMCVCNQGIPWSISVKKNFPAEIVLISAIFFTEIGLSTEI